MKGTALQQRSVSPRTHQQQSRLWSLIMCLLFLGLPALLSGAVLYGLARAAKQPRAFAWLALAGVAGLALLGWQWRTLVADLMQFRDAARSLAGILRLTPNHAVTFQQVTHAVCALWPSIWRLWMEALFLLDVLIGHLDNLSAPFAYKLQAMHGCACALGDIVIRLRGSVTAYSSHRRILIVAQPLSRFACQCDARSLVAPFLTV